MYISWTNDPFMRYVPGMKTASDPLAWVWMRTLFYFEAYVFPPPPPSLPLVPFAENERKARARAPHN